MHEFIVGVTDKGSTCSSEKYQMGMYTNALNNSFIHQIKYWGLVTEEKNAQLLKIGSKNKKGVSFI